MKRKEEEAFRKKQYAYHRYANARERMNQAYHKMDEAWHERRKFQTKLDLEFEKMQLAYTNAQDAWNDYALVRDRNNTQIDSIRVNADCEHQAMQECFERASFEYDFGDKKLASVYSQEGYDHRDRRDKLNSQMSELAREVKEARYYAESKTPKETKEAFRRAKDEYDQAKERHLRREAEFKELQAECQKSKEVFESFQEEHKRLKGDFNRKLEQVKANKKASKQKLASKVNMSLVRTKPFYLGTLFGENAKIVERNDGSGRIDIYFAGLNEAGDGIGHGHAVIDKDGNVSYLRDAWSSHNDYVINDRPKRGRPTHR